MAHYGNCTQLVKNKCPTECRQDVDSPVCGSDGNVYRSVCELRRQTCGQYVVGVAAHHCRTTASCNENCGNEKNFVCGSDNKFYANECEMKKQNCGLVYHVRNDDDVMKILLPTFKIFPFLVNTCSSYRSEDV